MERQYRKLEITPDSLLGCRFFDRLERADRAHIAQFCEGRCYRADTEIIRHGDTSRDVFFILSGQVDARLLTSKGKDLIFQELGRGEMFGELAAIDGEPRSMSVLSRVETSVIRISGPNFKDIVARIPSLAELIMLRLCALSRYLCVRLEEVLAYSVPDQIRLEVIRIVSKHPSVNGAVTIEPAPTHEEIARRLGTNREQVTRVMGDFAKRGVIIQTRQSWYIADVTQVRLMSEINGA
jgi:CRP/FNR family cyclic AMP-dependent transcriptional regulator